MTIGNRIRVAREAKKLTQEELGNACDTTKQTIFKYETGIITNIPLDRIEKMAVILDVSPAFLMGWSDNDATQTKNSAGVYAGGWEEEAINLLSSLSQEARDRELAYLRELATGPGK